MPRRPHLILFAPLALAGCGFGAVEVEPYDVLPGADQACAALLGDLPEVVSDAVTRDIEPAELPAAAWGQPPIVLRCGVGLPPDYQPDAVLTEIDGVAWLLSEGVGGSFFSTVDRDPIVEIAVPDDYDPATVLGELGPSIAANVPLRSPR
ncbi:MAG TPA: DUF3515 domain-containing protein [Jiangellaceae bacterium]|nr:DUF3515 domain-containing protein [Jiangellaceae bacterium]